MSDIFLSYNREDQARARLFAEAFEGQGLSVWWDVGLRTGEAYDEVTETALRTAKAVVVLWSKRSVVSRWVRAEATLADRNRTLVPCMIEPCERPVMFELVQTAELSHWQGAADDRAWQGFLVDLHRFIGRDVAPAPARASLAEIAAEPPRPVETLLAVLPFDNLSDDREMQFFSDGVSEDILGRIQRGSKLKVISRTSSFQFRGGDKPRAAAALKATHVVDGSIRRAGDKVRIAAYLTEAETQTTLWSDRFDRGLDDIFAVQDEISEAVAAALDMAFSPPKTAPIDPVVYDLYLRARQHALGPEDRAEGIAMMEGVTRIAPDFAEAWASLATGRLIEAMYLPYAERRAVKAQAESALARCVALNPDSADALQARWMACNPFGDYLAQAAIAQQFGQEGASDAVSLFTLAYFLEGVGRTREAVGLARRSRELDPRNGLASAMYGQALWRSGRYAEGIAAMDEHAETWPDDHDTAAVRILAAAHQGDWPSVNALIDPRRLALHPLREHSSIIGLMALVQSPDVQGRRILIDLVRQRAMATGHIEPVALVWPAALGFVDQIYDVLGAVRLGPSGGPDDTIGINAYRCHIVFAAAYPDLRADPRFVTLCARLGLVEYWLATQAWPDCADEVGYDFRAACERHRDYPKDRFFG